MLFAKLHCVAKFTVHTTFKAKSALTFAQLNAVKDAGSFGSLGPPSQFTHPLSETTT